ncbi:hypothetical protein [Helicobacter canis]|uniref:hypothetical protein n=1 Tax=Helicobacter canis TaxID=29419 RepID=UPI0011C04FB6|nr:hypothetical protein [Helicobacter canis]
MWITKEAAASPCFATIPLSQNLASERKTALSLESTFEGCLISQSLFYFNTILRVAVGLLEFFGDF